jgi:hypothetical protein
MDPGKQKASEAEPILEAHPQHPYRLGSTSQTQNFPLIFSEPNISFSVFYIGPIHIILSIIQLKIS